MIALTQKHASFQPWVVVLLFLSERVLLQQPAQLKLNPNIKRLVDWTLEDVCLLCTVTCSYSNHAYSASAISKLTTSINIFQARSTEICTSRLSGCLQNVCIRPVVNLMNCAFGQPSALKSEHLDPSWDKTGCLQLERWNLGQKTSRG